MSFRSRFAFAALPALLSVSLSPAARAADEGAGETSRAPSTTRAADTGTLLPFTNAATLEGQRAVGAAFGGYDSTRKSGLFEAAAEVRLWQGLSLRGGALYTSSTDTLRPSFGARYQF